MAYEHVLEPLLVGTPPPMLNARQKNKRHELSLGYSLELAKLPKLEDCLSMVIQDDRKYICNTSKIETSDTHCHPPTILSMNNYPRTSVYLTAKQKVCESTQAQYLSKSAFPILL
jgi:hypothetical protein